MPGTGTGRPSDVGRLFGPVSGMSSWLCVECPCGRRRSGDRAMLIGAGAHPAEPLELFVARLRCAHCDRRGLEAFLAFERDAKRWVKAP